MSTASKSRFEDTPKNHGNRRILENYGMTLSRKLLHGHQQREFRTQTNSREYAPNDRSSESRSYIIKRNPSVRRSILDQDQRTVTAGPKEEDTFVDEKNVNLYRKSLIASDKVFSARTISGKVKRLDALKNQLNTVASSSNLASAITRKLQEGDIKGIPQWPKLNEVQMIRRPVETAEPQKLRDIKMIKEPKEVRQGRVKLEVAGGGGREGEEEKEVYNYYGRDDEACQKKRRFKRLEGYSFRKRIITSCDIHSDKFKANLLHAAQDRVSANEYEHFRLNRSFVLITSVRAAEMDAIVGKVNSRISNYLQELYSEDLHHQNNIVINDDDDEEQGNPIDSSDEMESPKLQKKFKGFNYVINHFEKPKHSRAVFANIEEAIIGNMQYVLTNRKSNYDYAEKDLLWFSLQKLHKLILFRASNIEPAKVECQGTLQPLAPMPYTSEIAKIDPQLRILYKASKEYLDTYIEKGKQYQDSHQHISLWGYSIGKLMREQYEDILGFEIDTFEDPPIEIKTAAPAVMREIIIMEDELASQEDVMIVKPKQSFYENAANDSQVLTPRSRTASFDNRGKPKKYSKSYQIMKMLKTSAKENSVFYNVHFEKAYTGELNLMWERFVKVPTSDAFNGVGHSVGVRTPRTGHDERVLILSPFKPAPNQDQVLRKFHITNLRDDDSDPLIKAPSEPASQKIDHPLALGKRADLTIVSKPESDVVSQFGEESLPDRERKKGSVSTINQPIILKRSLTPVALMNRVEDGLETKRPSRQRPIINNTREGTMEEAREALAKSLREKLKPPTSNLQSKSPIVIRKPSFVLHTEPEENEPANKAFINSSTANLKGTLWKYVSSLSLTFRTNLKGRS